MRTDILEAHQNPPMEGPPEVQSICELILSQNQRRVEYIGSATSHFQAEPIRYDKQGDIVVRSDWEVELSRRLRGQGSGIPKADLHSLPTFLKRKVDYICRSSELSENMFRFSLDFGRLCPREGHFDDQLMAEYLETLALIRMRGQEPFLTLHHFTMPKWLTSFGRAGNITMGGWEHRYAARHFRFYIERVIHSLSDKDRIRNILQRLRLNADTQERLLSEGLCRYFMTLNEPAAALSNSYLTGIFPPYRRGNLFVMWRVLNSLVEAHDIAFETLKGGLKTQSYGPEIGLGHNAQYFLGPCGRVVRELQEYVTSRFERDGSHSDFLGVHYYFRYKMPLMPGARKHREYSDQPTFGDIYPPGIVKAIGHIHSTYPQKCIFVSEFGFSDRDDLRRPFWILETVRYIISASQGGIPIRGMLLWSLVDNFEWELGMSQKFGLFSESELTKSLVASTGCIRSWEVWSILARAITSPSRENQSLVQQCYETAYQQYKKAGGIY